MKLEEIYSVIGLGNENPKLLTLLDKLGNHNLDRDETHLSFIKFKSSGIEFAFKEKASLKYKADDNNGDYILETVFFYSEGVEGYSEYKGDLPMSITFKDDQSIIRTKLGEPIKSGGGHKNPILGGTFPKWDKYPLKGQLTFNVQYSENEQIDIILLTLFQ